MLDIKMIVRFEVDACLATEVPQELLLEVASHSKYFSGVFACFFIISFHMASTTAQGTVLHPEMRKQFSLASSHSNLPSLSRYGVTEGY
jgi:hypothetical protein